YRFHQVEPVRDLPHFAPRPILLIHGLKDTIVSYHDAICLYEAAGQPKDLWLIPDTEHIKGYFSDSAAYTSRGLDFFDHALRQVEPVRESQDARQSEQEAMKTSAAPVVHTPASPEQHYPKQGTHPRRTRQLVAAHAATHRNGQARTTLISPALASRRIFYR